MKSQLVTLILSVFVLWSCASEDPDLVNPPPSRTGIQIRFINLVPDALPRSLVMDQGYQSPPQVYAQIGRALPSPGDSTSLEIVRNGVTEYRSFRRQTFSRNTIVNVFAMAGSQGLAVADTAVVRTVTLPFGRDPVSSVRLVNGLRDSTLTYSLRKGCPSGPLLTTAPVSYKGASLYSNQPPGAIVFSLLERNASGEERTVGLYEADLRPGSANALIVYGDVASAMPRVLLLEESDTTAAAERQLQTVANRTGEVRVVNVSAFAATVRLASGQTIVSNLGNRRVGPISSVATCQQLDPDRYTVTLSNGVGTTDSTSLAVRERLTMVVFDDGAEVRSSVIPQLPALSSSTQARVRVMLSSTLVGSINVSAGGRTDGVAPTGVSAGTGLATSISGGEVGPAVILESGEFPFTVSTARTPTTLLHISRATLKAGGDYLLVVDGDATGLSTFFVEIGDADQALQPTENAVFLRYVNAAVGSESQRVDVGDAIRNGRVFYRNSVSTSVPTGVVRLSVDGAATNVTTRLGERTLVVASERNGASRVDAYTTRALPTLLGTTGRRALNATADVDELSFAYDSVPRQTPDAEHLFRDLSNGELSNIDFVSTARRGSVYVYNNATFEEMFRLPIDVVPLGSSVTLIVCGSKAKGYEVVALQEF